MEWYFELCAATNHWQELQDALRDKLRTQPKVQFNQRLSELAKKHSSKPIMSARASCLSFCLVSLRDLFIL